jgi:uncharacterized membrane protein
MMFSFKGGRRLGTIVLIASLALNGALGGFIAMKAWQRYQIASAGATPRTFLRMVRWRLPAADKAILDEAVKKKDAEFAAAQAESRQAMAAAIAALRRPDFNEAEFRAAVADVRAKRLRLADLGLEVFIDAAAHLSPEGRSALVPRHPPR